MLGSGGRTACAGPVFHFEPGFARTSGFPSHFDNCLLFWDWQRPFMKWARLDNNSNLVGIEPFTGAVTLSNTKQKMDEAEKAGEFVIRRPVDAQFGPDGCLYLLDYGETWGPNPDSKLIKISYQWGNLAPIARASASPIAGHEPLTVSFSSAGSKDIEGSPLHYEWRLFESASSSQTNAQLEANARILSTEANPQVILAKPGNYVVQLTVRDDEGANSKTSLPIVVGNTPPQVRFEAPQDGDFFTPGKPIAYKVRVVDAEDGDSAHYEELMDSRVFVSAQWSRGDGKEEVSHPGLALMKQSDCFNCHALETKIVGPAYVDVANKYRGQPGALEASVQRVIKGSIRLWGDAPMLSHESFTSDQVHLMVQWIFDLKAGASHAGLTQGLAGKIVPPVDQSVRMATVEAAYTDGGGAPAAPLSGKAQLKLRTRRLEAEQADIINGPKIAERGDASGNHALGQINRAHSITFNNLDLADSASITCRVANGGTSSVIEFRDGTAKGEILASIDVKSTGAWNKWVELTAPLKIPNHRTTVCLTFSAIRAEGLVDLDWIQFDPR